MFGLSETIILYDLLWIRLGYSNLKRNLLFWNHMIWKYCKGLCPMIECIENFENLPAYKLIISVDNRKNLSRFAIFMHSFIDIWHMKLPFTIFDESNSFSYIRILLDLFLYSLSCMILRRIIDDYYAVIIVLLLHNGVKIYKISKIIDIFICRNYDTKSNLRIETYVISCFIIKIL